MYWQWWIELGHISAEYVGQLMKSPRVTGELIVFGPFPPSPSPQTSEANFFKPHMVDLWVWENCLLPISVILGQGH